MSNSLSVIICCYNSIDRIAPTLQHLAQQVIPIHINCELLIVDNNSTDGTAQFCKKYWLELKQPFPINIIYEKQPGTGNARRKGLSSTDADFVLFVDDDNYLAKSYIEIVISIFEKHPTIAACGGYATLPKTLNYQLPFWWNDFKHAYAVGEQSSTSRIKQLVTAGMGLRMEAYHQLAKNNYSLLLSGRKGSEILSAGEDNEICYVLQLLGYEVFYSSNLKFYHAIEPSRINADYLIKMYQGNGLIVMYLSAYISVLKGGKHNWWREWWYGFALVTFFSISFLLFTILKNNRLAFKQRIKLIINLTRLQQILSISPDEYDTICNQIKSLKISSSNTN